MKKSEASLGDRLFLFRAKRTFDDPRFWFSPLLGWADWTLVKTRNESGYPLKRKTIQDERKKSGKRLAPIKEAQATASRNGHPISQDCREMGNSEVERSGSRGERKALYFSDRKEEKGRAESVER
jgi:hypothetical protein